MEMPKPIIMMAAGAVALLALGVAIAQTTTTDKSGNSTATITQDGTPVKRKVTKTPDGQTIVQQSGGNKVNIQQGSSTDECEDKAAAKKAGKTASKDDDCDE